MRKSLTALLFLPILSVGAWAFWPQAPEDPHTGWCKQYPAACAYEDYPNGPRWTKFVEDRRNGLR